MLNRCPVEILLLHLCKSEWLLDYAPHSSRTLLINLYIALRLLGKQRKHIYFCYLYWLFFLTSVISSEGNYLKETVYPIYLTIIYFSTSLLDIVSGRIRTMIHKLLHQYNVFTYMVYCLRNEICFSPLIIKKYVKAQAMA